MKQFKERVPSRSELVCPVGEVRAYDWRGGNFDIADETADTVTIMDTTLPLDAPRTFWLKCQKVGNIYTHAPIDTAYKAAAKGGIKCIVNLRDILTIEDDTDSTYRVDYPIEAQVVFTIPYCELITENLIQQELNDAVAALYAPSADGSTAVSRALKMARGIASPV